MPRDLAATDGSDWKAPVVYHYCRLQLPAVRLDRPHYDAHLRRMFELYRGKSPAATWEHFIETLHPLDAFLCAACLENDSRAWEALFAARAGRADRLLVDALRARAVRLFPRDEERRENSVAEFWGHLIVSETPGSVPVLRRYDGQRPLVPWLIRVFQNWLISALRGRDTRTDLLADDDLVPDPDPPAISEARWHEVFCDAARTWLAALPDQELLLLGLRLRYNLSQRHVADLLGKHEGTISRQITEVQKNCFAVIEEQMTAAGWSGDDLSSFVRSEMAALLTDEPRLSADHLAHILAAKGKALPA